MKAEFRAEFNRRLDRHLQIAEDFSFNEVMEIATSVAHEMAVKYRDEGVKQARRDWAEQANPDYLRERDAKVAAETLENMAERIREGNEENCLANLYGMTRHIEEVAQQYRRDAGLSDEQ